MTFRIEEFDATQGWVTVRRNIAEHEREGLEAANAAALYTNEEIEPVAGQVRLVDES